MKWFLIQSIFLAALAFGLGALFHRLLWRKLSGVTSSTSTDVNRFGSAGGASSQLTAKARAVDARAVDARARELAALRTEHDKVIADRDAKLKELSALSFEHSAAKASLAERDASLVSLRGGLDGAKNTVSDGASAEIQGLTGQLDSHRSTISDLEAKMTAATVDNDAALATLRTDHEERLTALRREHDLALAAVKSEHDGALGGLRNEADGRIDTLTACHDSAIVSLRADHDRAIQEVHGDRDRALSGLRSDHEKALGDLRRRSETAEVELAKVRSECDVHISELSMVRSDLDAREGEIQSLMSTLETTNACVADAGRDEAFEGAEIAADDLLRIEGIGPKINEILLAGGVRTLRRLAAMPEDSVRMVVNAGGISFIPSANTWAAQAALLRDGDEAGFQALVDKLVAGRDDSR